MLYLFVIGFSIILQPQINLPTQGIDCRRDSLCLVRIDERLVDRRVPDVGEGEGVAVDSVQVPVPLRSVGKHILVLVNARRNPVHVPPGVLRCLSEDVAKDGGDNRLPLIEGNVLE